MPSANERTRQTTKDWDAKQWASSEAKPDIDEDVEGSGSPAGTGAAKHWNKDEWVGDRGDGSNVRRQSPDEMPEGESALSGMRHNPGEQHWAERDTKDTR